MVLACAALSAGCGTTGSVNDGAGYAALTPAPETAAWIVNHDERFARQVVAHNMQCAKDELCRKGK
ncbi:hypothetical protein RvVAR0630_18330 [Agrobacterium vitis]|nr:hypothetical protein RvVAR0630_18330 [Agrobacterium vitis]